MKKLFRVLVGALFFLPLPILADFLEKDAEVISKMADEGLLSFDQETRSFKVEDESLFELLKEEGVFEDHRFSSSKGGRTIGRTFGR